MDDERDKDTMDSDCIVTSFEAASSGGTASANIALSNPRATIVKIYTPRDTHVCRNITATMINNGDGSVACRDWNLCDLPIARTEFKPCDILRDVPMTICAR